MQSDVESARTELVVGLDVGTTKICAVIAEPAARPARSTSSGSARRPRAGLRKGVVVNIDSTVEAIKQAVAEAEQMAGVEVVRRATPASPAATSAASTAAASSRSRASTAR